ncbi:hypothetical protein CKM354_000917600 [Cercospora kikuchii]|uniref:Glutathione S-transferase kappa n=1 Tax=Cercospora kikuchii TaxID=84275 RepID=A0A9P3FJV3_9PEZI|nr:uncharacterized protein CKM354_000917600 [Cercospora kikuchii]GIZ46034.1 hypothetical protein CKM354_000917600 [Cercospora kikuchii]
MGKGGRIDVYLDCNSPYSYFTHMHIRRIRPQLAKHHITISMHPIFLGGINVGSGNKPPWTLPAKATMGTFDGARAKQYFKVPEPDKFSAPPFFPIMSLLPMRALLFVREELLDVEGNVEDREKFEKAFGELWNMLWREHEDISKPEVLVKCLGRHLKKEEAERAVKAAREEKWKKMLVDETGRLVEKGAYGAPWFIVKNAKGVEEPFFGSDRFHYIYQFLGVPFRDIEILPPGGEKEAKL